jgi:flagellar protein FlaI
VSKPENYKFELDDIHGTPAGVLLEEYNIGAAKISITNDNGVGRYTINEPPITDKQREILGRLIDQAYKEVGFKEIRDPLSFLQSKMTEIAVRFGVANEVKKFSGLYEYYLTRTILGYGRIDVLVNDENIEDINLLSYHAPIMIVHKNHTEFDWLRTNVTFSSERDAEDIALKVLNKAGKIATAAVPIVDARTKENHRIAVRFGYEASMNGTGMSIRKFPSSPITFVDLIKSNTITPLMIAYAWMMLEAKGVLFVTGKTGSGKTTLLNTLISLINPNQSICVIEDIPELLPPQDNVNRLVSRHAYSLSEAKYDISLQDLVKYSLRVRPDFDILGEIRGPEAAALITMALTGHGALTSLHADTPENAVLRLTAAPMDVPKDNISLIWAFIGMVSRRLDNGRIVRRCSHITEVDQESSRLFPVFNYDVSADSWNPTTVNELVQKRTPRLEQLKVLNGWSDEALKRELHERDAFVQQLVTNNTHDINNVGAAVREFYVTKYKLDQLKDP